MDHYIGPDGKPCRACVSVEDLMKKGRELAQKRKDKESSSNDASKPGTSTAELPTKNDCPADKDELGRSTWTLLHTMSVYYPESAKESDKKNATTFLSNLSRLYPCDYCAKDLQKDLAESPPKLNTRQEFATWMCELHNKVNDKLGKPKFDCTKVFERWRDGWKDGSCDY
ncbi:unnamed protein product, partial [Mesorhabditis spiculigera]